jgi:transposase
VTHIGTTLEGLYELRRRLDDEHLEPGDWPLLRALVTQKLNRTEAQQERMLHKVAAAAAAAKDDARADPDVDGSVPDDESEGGPASGGARQADSGGGAGAPSTGDDAEREQEKPGKQRKGHGRNGVGAYRNAAHFFHALKDGVLGGLCPKCGLSKVYRKREKAIIHILGQPVINAEVHHYEEGRCRNCGHVERANGPAEAHEGLGTDYIRYDWSACGMLLVMHYSAGMPFKRLESLQEGWGIPIPDANQWQVVDAADDLLLPLYKALEQHAIAKATNFRTDDTGSMVVELQKQIDAEIAALERLGESTKDARTGINATGFYWETPDGPVVLYYTGRHHAGEMVDQLLRRRLLSSPKLVKITDGASKNFDHEHGDKLIEATCNAHAFLKFRDIRDKYPAEYAEAGDIYKQVFDHDDEAKALELTPMDRMLFHRKYSWPLMKKLKAMCEEKVKSKLVEPSSPLWEPLTFIINQWDRLTRFCKVPGVPLDTNLIEQALIMPVRYLAGSFNYKTEDGATVGDHAMSLIATARAHGVEPVAYLTECLRCHEDLAKRPDHYLPWVYRKRIEEGDSAPGSARSPSEPQPGSNEQARGLRDLAPEVRERATRRVATPDQDLQLASEQV